MTEDKPPIYGVYGEYLDLEDVSSDSIRINSARLLNRAESRRQFEEAQSGKSLYVEHEGLTLEPTATGFRLTLSIRLVESSPEDGYVDSKGQWRHDGWLLHDRIALMGSL